MANNKLYEKLGSSEAKKIAVLRALQLGDMLVTVPALRALRYAFPQTEISLIGLPWAKEFVQRFDTYLDRHITFPGYPGLPEQSANPASITSFVENMKKEQFDVILQMQGNGTYINELLPQLGAKYICGYYPADDIAPEKELFMQYPDAGTELERMLELMKFLGIETHGTFMEFPISDEEEREYKHLANYYMLDNDMYVCLHAGARDPRRRWNSQSFAELGDALYSEGYTTVLTGTNEDKGLTQEIINRMQYPAIDLAGETSLGATAALIKKAKLVVTNDTGMSHIAAATGIPSVVIFSEFSDPRRWAPLNKTLHQTVDSNHATVEEVLKQVHIMLQKTQTAQKEKTVVSKQYVQQEVN